MLLLVLRSHAVNGGCVRYVTEGSRAKEGQEQNEQIEKVDRSIAIRANRHFFIVFIYVLYVTHVGPSSRGPQLQARPYLSVTVLTLCDEFDGKAEPLTEVK